MFLRLLACRKAGVMVAGMGMLIATAVASAPAANAAPGSVKSPEAAATITWRWENGFYLQIRNASTATGVRAVIHAGNGSARTQRWRAIILGNHEFAFKRSYPNADRWFENAGASGRFALQNVADIFGRAACARNTPAHNNFVTMGQIGSGNCFWH